MAAEHEPMGPLQLAGEFTSGNWRKAYRNDRFSVLESVWDTRIGVVVSLQVQRLDGMPGIQWYEMQQIKDQLYPDRQGVELLPPKSDIVDTHNIYHIWVLPAGGELPLNLKDGFNGQQCRKVHERGGDVIEK